MSTAQLLSLGDVAERLQVSEQAVRRWVKDGRLPAYKPGLEWRIDPEDLQHFLENSRPKVGRPPRKESDDSPRRASAWMGDSFAELIHEWEQAVAEGDDPAHILAIARAIPDAVNIVAGLGKQGEAPSKEFSENERRERDEVSDRLLRLASKALYMESGEKSSPVDASKPETIKKNIEQQIQALRRSGMSLWIDDPAKTQPELTPSKSAG